jgi:outer membrane protein TolC
MKSVTRRCIATLAAIAWFMPARAALAQDTSELTLASAIGQALRQDPSLELAAATVARAESGVRDAQSSRLPSLHVDANVTRFAEPMVVAPLHGFDPRNPPSFDRTLSQGSASLSYTVFDASRGARVDRAQALAGAAYTGERAARMQLLADVTRLYLQLSSARELAGAHTLRVTALEREEDRAAQLVQQGRAARVVLLRAQAALSAAQAENVFATSNVDVAANALARQLGINADSLRSARLRAVRAAAREPIDIAALHAVARDSNPDLERARRHLAAAEAGRSEARGSWLPRLQLGGRFIEYASTETHPQGEWQGALQLSYPVFTGGARIAANDRAAADVSAARAEYALATRRIGDAIDRAASALTAARARTTALEAAVMQSEEVTRIDRLALDAGAGVQSDYLTAEADLFRARSALTDARAAELIALVELARITGRLSQPWLADNVESYQ